MLSDEEIRKVEEASAQTFHGEPASYSLRQKDRDYIAEPPQPELNGKVPRVTKDSRTVKGVRFFAPFRATDQKVQILGVGIAPTPEEASGLLDAGNNVEMPITPRLLKGPLYSILIDSLSRNGKLSDERFAYTTVIPWLLPKSRRFKPKPDELAWAVPALHDLIDELKPECILAFGKVAFDQLCNFKISADDARGGWFTYKDTNIPLYLMDSVVSYITQPWTLEMLLTDFREIGRFLIGTKGMMEEHIVEEYREVRTMEQLEELVALWERENCTRISVDCEWAGAHYIDGRLRSIQFCWAPGKGAYLNFFDENGTPILGAKENPHLTASVAPGNTQKRQGGPIGASGGAGEPVERQLVFPGPTPPGGNYDLFEEIDAGLWRLKPAGGLQSATDLQGYAYAYPAPPSSTYKKTESAERPETKEKTSEGNGIEHLDQTKSGESSARREKTNIPESSYRRQKTKADESPGITEKTDDLEGIQTGDVDASPVTRDPEIDYEGVGRVLGRWLNRPEVKYLGQHFSADSVWMEHWLNLDVLGKCEFDLEFAVQTCNEYAKLGLEIMAMRYTTFGRYDMDLVLWKKANAAKMKADEGYGAIPDSILIPYAIKDCDVVIRSYQPVMDDLERQGLKAYYQGHILPFVTDTFHTFITTGLHVDRDLFTRTRAFFNWAYKALLEDFRQMMHRQADTLIADLLGVPENVIAELSKLRDAGKVLHSTKVLDQLAANLPEEKKIQWPDFRDHWSEIRSFNIRSAPQMRRWLFTILGLTPLKTTANKANNMPAMMWDKVMELPEKLRKTLLPAVDKETIEILSESDPTGSLVRLLAVSNVGNQCKGFLKEGDYDLDGELIKENGLAKFIGSDDIIRPNISLTETSRPRTFRPNILNLSKYHNKGVENGLCRVLENPDNSPVFNMPQEFYSLLGTPEEIEGKTARQLIKKRMPSVRSVVRAPDGWCYCESDYQTAEVRSLAFVSGDTALLKLILGKDKSFGLCAGKPVRLYYDEHSSIAREFRDPKFLMAVCEEGKEPVPVTEEQLDRLPDGAIKHPKFDMHWAVAEESQKRPRETMSADRDRGAGKVTRFCIAAGELVLTRDRGEVAIENVLGCDLLWDGVEWVSHEGVIYSGYKKVVSYQGLKATEKHKVWTEERGKVSLGEACAQSLTLVRTGRESGCLAYTGDNHSSRIFETRGAEAILHGGHCLPGLRGKALEVSSESGERLLVEVQVPDGDVLQSALSGYAMGGCGVVESSLPGDAATLREGYTHLVDQLQGARDQVLLSERSGVRRLGTCELVSGGDHGQGVRSSRQRRALRGFKPAACDASGECAAQAVHYGDSSGNRTAVLEGQSDSEVYGEYGAGFATVGLHPRADYGEGESQYSRGEEEEAHTYDILNAGPRNRFTCSGVLVSNSGSYGAVGATIDRRIEAVTGIKPEPGTGQKMLDALAESQPVATEFLNEVALAPKKGQELKAASGRIRHFPVHSSELRGMPWRVKNGYLRAMGNEARNFYMQESVAATIARACQWLNAFFRKNGMKARTAIALYDAMLTLCPLEERFVVAAAHQVMMCDINVWEYHGRYMNYPIDTDFVYRWSWKPSPKEKEELENPDFCSMPKERESQLLGEIEKIKNTFFDVQPDIKDKLNVI